MPTILFLPSSPVKNRPRVNVTLSGSVSRNNICFAGHQNNPGKKKARDFPKKEDFWALENSFYQGIKFKALAG